MGGTASSSVSSPASEVFALLTDVDCLPEWNKAIVEVVERPEELPGAEWVVQLRVAASLLEHRGIKAANLVGGIGASAGFPIQQ